MDADYERTRMYSQRVLGEGVFFPSDPIVYSDYEQVVERELQADNSDRAKLNAIAAEAVRPLPESKQKWLDNLSMHRDKFKLSELREAAYSMFPSEQIGLFNNNSERIFATLDQINAENSPELISTYASIFPLMCNQEDTQKIKDTLAEKHQLKPMLVKALKNHLYSSGRCIPIGRYWHKTASRSKNRLLD